MWYKLKRMLIWLNQVRLPSEYQEVEYIQSSGTQWIDWLRLPVDFKFTITAQFESTNQYYNVYDTTEARPMLWVYTNWRFELNIDNMTAVWTIDNSKFITVVSDALWNTNKLLVDWVQVVEWTKISSISKDTTLFHRGASDGFKWKIKYVLIEGTGWKIRELIPCYRVSDWTIWLYDLVEWKFYTNSWTWTFTKWADIPDMEEKQVRPKSKTEDFYFSGNNFNEFQGLVDDIGSIQFVDTWLRFRFNPWVYVWNRVAIDFDWSTMRKINLDTLSVISTASSNVDWQVWYFWDGRILTRKWIIDTDWTYITQFASTFDSVSPWDTWVVWANIGYDIYKWEVNWDNITFSKIWTWWTDQMSGWMCYWYLWAYLLNYNDTYWGWYSSYVNISNDNISNFSWWSNSRDVDGCAWADWKLYRLCVRDNWWWRLQKIWTWNEWFVWTSLNTWWTAYWRRYVKFLWNIVSWWMNSNNWTWNWYWSNNYFIDSSWNLSLVQYNALAYDTEIRTKYWFIDEKWYIYPHTWWWWSWVILKTDKIFTDLNRKNPYLWR